MTNVGVIILATMLLHVVSFGLISISLSAHRANGRLWKSHLKKHHNIELE